MSVVPNSVVSSTLRPLGLRKRADLVCRRQTYQDRAFWIVKDPLDMRYYRVREEEFAVLQMLDGSMSLEAIQEAFEDRFAPLKVELSDVSHLLAQFHAQGLVYSESAGQGEQLLERRRKRSGQEWLGRLASPMAIRFSGIDPQWIFARVYPRVRWVFSPVCVAICAALAAAALLLVVVRLDEFRSRLPAYQEFFTFDTGLVLMAVMGVTKVLHEFGHGLACRHFGGTCTELGFLLLCLTPCLYCNVSDSWMIGNKWKRAAIGAGGMYVEVVLASLATFVWWFTTPGLVNYLALATMLICSVSTLAINGNPLLRYDGYYILSDLIEIPNLAQKATQLLRRFANNWLLGIELPPDPFLPTRHGIWFALYAVASTVYRVFIVCMILWFVYQFLKPYHLETVAYLVGAIMLVGMSIQPVTELWRFLRMPPRLRRVSNERARATLAGALVGVLALFIVPLPHHVYGTLELKPQHAQMVYVEVPGQLAEVCATEGSTVEAGQTVARLENLDLALSIAQLVARRDEWKSKLDTARRQRFEDPASPPQVAEIEKSLASFEEQLAEKRLDRNRLNLVAQHAGTILPGAVSPLVPANREELKTWSGSPFDPKNRGCSLTEGTVFCQIGDPARYEALVVFDQADLQWVHSGQNVRVKLDELPHATLRGTIEEVSRSDLRVTPKSLSNKSGGELSSRTDAAGVERPMSVSYQARVPLEGGDAEDLRRGLRGRTKIDVGWSSVGSRAWRSFCQTFYFTF